MKQTSKQTEKDECCSYNFVSEIKLDRSFLVGAVDRHLLRVHVIVRYSSQLPDGLICCTGKGNNIKTTTTKWKVARKKDTFVFLQLFDFCCSFLLLLRHQPEGGRRRWRRVSNQGNREACCSDWNIGRGREQAS